jgi:diguanylate cyclase
MFFYENAQQAAEYVRQAIPLMVKHKIVPNPHNFALWYIYVSGKNKALNQALDEAINESGTVLPELCYELFVQHVVNSRKKEDDQTRETLEDLIESLASGMEKAATNTRDYENTLQEGLQNLQSSSEKEDVESTIKELLQSTEASEEVHQAFEKQLGDAREEIQFLKSQLEASKEDAFKDPLTKLGNRRFFDSQLNGALIRKDSPTSLLIIDLDHFKKINDTYGHLMGDKILQSMGVILGDYNSEEIASARYGGEEFALIMKNSPLETAAKTAETIRQKISQLQVRQKNDDSVIDSLSVSIGVAQYKDREEPENFIERADKALYAAKEGGRNQVQCAA